MKADERAVDIPQRVGHVLILAEDIAKRSKRSVTRLPNPSVAGCKLGAQWTKMTRWQRDVTPKRRENREGADVKNEGDAAEDEQSTSPCRSALRSDLFITGHTEEMRATPNDPKLSDGGAWRGSCEVRRRRGIPAK